MLKRILLIIAVTVLVIIGFFAAFLYSKSHIMFWDAPGQLSDKKETIEVHYIAWACDCANWLETKHSKPDGEIREEDCIFIEPANKQLEVPDKFWEGNHLQKKLRLTGSFYNNKGIPKEYEMVTSIKPEKARVFRYTKLEIIK